MANISMDPHPTNYLRQNIVFSYPEMIRGSFSLFLCLSVFCYFTLLLIFIKIVLLLLLLFYLFIFMKMFFFFSCSGMFLHVPECSMFRILSTATKMFSVVPTTRNSSTTHRSRRTTWEKWTVKWFWSCAVACLTVAVVRSRRILNSLILIVTGITWSSFSSQNSKTHALFRLCFVTLRSDL